MKKIRGAVLLATIVSMALLAGAASAGASTVTIGSPLTATWVQAPMCSSTCTEANTKIGESGAQLAAPSAGTIVRWRIDDSAGTFRLLVLRPDGSGHFSAVAMSPAQTPVGTGIETFPADISVQAGDLIGLDNEESSAEIGYTTLGVTGSQFTYFSPQMVVGSNSSTSTTITPSENEELAFNADVESAAAAPVPLPAPAPLPAPTLTPPVPTCKVPNLRGKKLKVAKKKLVAADCKLGKVKKKRGVTAKTGKVKKQGTKPGKILVADTKVNVTLG
jgi:hypothetical protein